MGLVGLVELKDGGGVGGGGDDGDGAGREGGAGGEVGGGVGGGGGDEWPSTLRVEKVGMTGLATAVTRRLPDSGGGDGRRRGVGLLSGALVAAASARAAWCAAARWLQRALARGLRRR